MTHKARITSLLAIIFFLFTPFVASADSDEFKVGMEAGYPPFNWTQSGDANGAVKISGSADYAGEIGRAHV